MPVMAKLIGLIIIGAIVLSPYNEPKLAPSETYNIENAQAMADRLGKPVKVWMDGIGHIIIKPADEAPVVPFTILNSTWVPRKR